MRHADVELHRRTMHRSGSGRSAATTTATFVVSSPSAAFSGDAKPDLLSLDSPSQRNAHRGGARGQGKPRKYLCVMCDASFLQKAHLVRNLLSLSTNKKSMDRAESLNTFYTSLSCRRRTLGRCTTTRRITRAVSATISAPTRDTILHCDLK